MKWPLIIVMSFLFIACGKSGTSTITSASVGTVDPLTSKKEFQVAKEIGDETCIDEVLFKELVGEQKVKKVEKQSDLSFCNGLRVRVKIFKINNGETRVYGFAESTSGKKSCLKQDSDFNHTTLLGYSGTLMGDKIKISLGGHSYDKEGKLIRSDRLMGKHVKLDIASFKGEIGFFESDKLKCYSLQ